MDNEVLEPIIEPKETKKKGGILQNILSWVATILAAFVAAMIINTYLIRTSMIYGESMVPTLQPNQVVMLSKLPYIFGEEAFGDVVVLDSNCLYDTCNQCGRRMAAVDEKARCSSCGDVLDEKDAYSPSTFADHIVDSLKYNVISQKLFNIHDTEERYWIKRIIGLPGDVIEFKDNNLYRNGELLEEDYINRGVDGVNYEDPRNRYAFSSYTVPEGYLFVMGDNRNYSKDSRMMGPVDMRAVVGKVLSGV